MTDSNADKRLVYDVPEAGEMLGLTRNAAYEAAKRGDIPTMRQVDPGAEAGLSRDA